MHRVVVVGSGFGGPFATRRLIRAPVEVTVVDRTAHHLFQPLLHQVANGALVSWTISMFGRTRHERTIALQQVLARRAPEQRP